MNTLSSEERVLNPRGVRVNGPSPHIHVVITSSEVNNITFTLKIRISDGGVSFPGTYSSGTLTMLTRPRVLSPRKTCRVRAEAQSVDRGRGRESTVASLWQRSNIN